jgi:hypothetical protein
MMDLSAIVWDVGYPLHEDRGSAGKMSTNRLTKMTQLTKREDGETPSMKHRCKQVARCLKHKIAMPSLNPVEAMEILL